MRSFISAMVLLRSGRWTRSSTPTSSRASTARRSTWSGPRDGSSFSPMTVKSMHRGTCTRRTDTATPARMGTATVMFDYEFMRNAFYACTIVAIVAGAVGYFLVLRGETFAGHALAHVGFPGATGALLLGLQPILGLGLFTVIAGIGIGLLGSKAQRDV